MRKTRYLQETTRTKNKEAQGRALAEVPIDRQQRTSHEEGCPRSDLEGRLRYRKSQRKERIPSRGSNGAKSGEHLPVLLLAVPNELCGSRTRSRVLLVLTTFYSFSSMLRNFSSSLLLTWDGKGGQGREQRMASVGPRSGVRRRSFPSLLPRQRNNRSPPNSVESFLESTGDASQHKG